MRRIVASPRVAIQVAATGAACVDEGQGDTASVLLGCIRRRERTQVVDRSGDLSYERRLWVRRAAWPLLQNSYNSSYPIS